MKLTQAGFIGYHTSYIQTYNKLYLEFFGTVEVAKNMLITDKMTSCEMSHEILNIILKHLP